MPIFGRFERRSQEQTRGACKTPAGVAEPRHNGPLVMKGCVLLYPLRLLDGLISGLHDATRDAARLPLQPFAPPGTLPATVSGLTKVC